MSYASERKILTPVLRKLADRDVDSLGNRDFSAAEQVLARWGRKPKKLDPKLHKKLIEQKKEKQSSRASHNQETGDIRIAVRARAGGVCEGCGKRWGFWLWTMDHWENGIGRKRQKQAVSNCWALCGNLLTPQGCHYKRQHYIPSVEFWNAAFAAHAAKHGYPALPHIEHADLPNKEKANA